MKPLKQHFPKRNFYKQIAKINFVNKIIFLYFKFFLWKLIIWKLKINSLHPENSIFDLKS